MPQRILYILLFLLGSFVYAAAQPGTVTWKKQWAELKPSPATWSTPVLMDGNIYWQCQDGGMMCFNAATGSFIWADSTNLGYSVNHPAGHNGKIFADGGNKFWCLDASDGSIRWSAAIDAQPGIPTPARYNRIFVASADSLYSLNQDNGAAEWKLGFKARGMLLKPDGSILLVNTDSILFAFDPLTGNIQWAIGYAEYGSVGGNMAVSGDYLVIGTGDNFANQALEKYYCFNLDTKTTVWEKGGIGYSGIYNTPPAILNNKVYISTRSHSGSEPQMIRAFNLLTGDSLWAKPARYGSSGSTPHITALDGNVFYQNDGADTTLPAGYICADAATGDTIRTAKLPGGSATLWGSILIDNNKMYVAEDFNGLFCLDAGTVNGSWRMFGANHQATGSYDANLLLAIGGPVAARSSIKLYPNPAADGLYLEPDKLSAGKVQLELINAAGQKMGTEELVLQEQVPVWIHTAQLARGIYRLNMLTENGLMHSVPFIIVK